jgi:hypothetical protein
MGRTWTEIKKVIGELSSMEHGLRMRLTPIAIGWGKVCIDAIEIGKSVEDVADEGGMPSDYIDNCYQVVSAWEGYELPEDVVFSVFEDLIRPSYQAKLVELGFTKEEFLDLVIGKRNAVGGRVRVDDVRKALGVAPARRKRTTALDRAETAAEDLNNVEVVEQLTSQISLQAAVNIVKQLAADRPDVMTVALNDTETSSHVTRAYRALERENEGVAENMLEKAGFSGLNRAGSYYQSLSNLTHILTRAKETLDLLDDLDHMSTAQADQLLAQARKGEAALKFIVSSLEGNDMDMDEELLTLLED